MSSLNKRIFDTSYEYLCENGHRAFVNVIGENIISHPVIRQFVKPYPGVPGLEILTLNVTPQSCKAFSTDDGLFFSGRFGGRLAEETIPWSLIKHLFCPDNQQVFISLPNALLSDAGLDEAEVVKLPTKKANPFSVIFGGKE